MASRIRRRAPSLVDHALRMRSLGVGSVFARKRWYSRPGELLVVTGVEPYARASRAAEVHGVVLRPGRSVLTVPVESVRVRGALKRDWALLFDAEVQETVLPRSLSDPERSAWSEGVLREAVEEAARAGASPDWNARVRQSVALWRAALGPIAHFGEAPGCGPLQTVPPARLEGPPAVAPSLFAHAARLAARASVRDAVLDEWSSLRSTQGAPVDGLSKLEWVRARYESVLPDLEHQLTPAWAGGAGSLSPSSLSLPPL